MTDHAFDYMLGVYTSIQSAMLASVYTTNRGHFLCTRRFCDHWQICETENGGEVKP